MTNILQIPLLLLNSEADIKICNTVTDDIT